MKTVGVIIVIAIVAATWLIVAKKNGPVPAADSTASESTTANDTQAQSATHQSETVTITYTDAGFNPSMVEINVGDSVIFMNRSSSDFQPASNPHPIHTALPGFDAGTGVAPGQSYTMTFAKAGRWGFHNHLNSSDTGTVVVR
jgi:plastocyanin